MMFRTGMSEARYKLRTIRWVGQVLERLWADQTSDTRLDDAEEGCLWDPRGLAVVIKNKFG